MSDQEPGTQHPSYDFVAPPAPPTQPTPTAAAAGPFAQFGPPAPPAPPTPAAPFTQFGAPAAPRPIFPPPSGAPVPPGTPFPGVRPQPGRSRAATTAIVIAAVAGGLVIVGILAAIAIPVFLNQKGNADAQTAAATTTITLPDVANGWPRLTGAADARVQAGLAAMPPGSNAQAAAYGLDSTVLAVVIAGHRPMPPAERHGFFLGAAKTETGDYQVTLSTVDPGPLGGEMKCGETSNGRQLHCYYVDAGSYGVIDIAEQGSAGRAAVQAIRASVEHHA